jgi:DeoR/GlpR family transcriptional regulator of sugar metabolism
MLSQERQRHILDYLRRQKSAKVVKLSAQLGISLSTVRRDLNEMEERGLVQRVHGGVVLVENTPSPESPALVRSADMAAEKRRIGECAASLVHDGETIIITGGTTTEAMLPLLADKQNLNVITNVISHAYYLAKYSHITVIVLGGWLRHSEYSLLGHLTQQGIRDLVASKLFHGTYGFDTDYGLTGTYVQEVETDRHLLRATKQLIVLADSSKFERAGQIRIAPIEQVSTVITDRDAPDHHVANLRDKGIEVMLV